MLSPLSNSKSALLQIAGGPSSGCPTSALYACPIQHKHFTLPSAPGISINGSIIGAYNGVAPFFSGTKEPNALCLVIPADGLCLASHTPAAVAAQGFAWKAANGARNCVADGSSWPCPPGTANNQARRVLIIMTDGQDEAWPTTLVGNQNPQTTNDCGLPEAGAPLAVPTYDSHFKTLASHLKAAQADGSPGVEIYVVGFFCTDNPGSYTSGNYSTFCQSKIAYDPAATRACPGPGYTPGTTGSPIDDLLVNVSSSTGTSLRPLFLDLELALVLVAYYSETRMARETARYLAVHSRLTDDSASRPASCKPASSSCVPSVLDHINQTMLPGLVGGTISSVTTDATTGDSIATVGNMTVQWTPCTWNGTVCTYAGQGANPSGSARSAGSTLHVELQYNVSNLLFLPTTFRFGSLTVAMPTGLPKYRVSVMVE